MSRNWAGAIRSGKANQFDPEVIQIFLLRSGHKPSTRRDPLLVLQICRSGPLSAPLASPHASPHKLGVAEVYLRQISEAHFCISRQSVPVSLFKFGKPVTYFGISTFIIPHPLLDMILQLPTQIAFGMRIAQATWFVDNSYCCCEEKSGSL